MIMHLSVFRKVLAIVSNTTLKKDKTSWLVLLQTSLESLGYKSHFRAYDQNSPAAMRD